MKKYYYRCMLTQTAPLRIGAGFGEKTDSDVVKDSRGYPLIPGTSLAGVLRSLCPEALRNDLFGAIRPKPIESKVLISDAVLAADTKEHDFRISRRDGVGLDENGVNSGKAKFDFEVVESKAPYCAILELSDDAAESDIKNLEALLYEIQENGINLGARTTRGYGSMRVEIQKKVFALPKEMDAYLAFDPFTADAAKFDKELERPAAEYAQATNKMIRISATLCAVGSYSVRVNTTMLPEESSQEQFRQTAPDMMPLQNIYNKPVVPGTSWSGCFRHHLRRLAREIKRPELVEEIDALFGVDQKRRSKIVLRETAFDGSKHYTATRNALDRFAAKPKKQALFTADVAQGGTGVLHIELPADTQPDLLRLLAASINDLHLGLLSFGGESGVGRGRCKITELTVNGADKLNEMISLSTEYLLGREEA